MLASYYSAAGGALRLCSFADELTISSCIMDSWYKQNLHEVMKHLSPTIKCNYNPSMAKLLHPRLPHADRTMSRVCYTTYPPNLLNSHGSLYKYIRSGDHNKTWHNKKASVYHTRINALKRNL